MTPPPKLAPLMDCTWAGGAKNTNSTKLTEASQPSNRSKARTWSATTVRPGSAIQRAHNNRGRRGFSSAAANEFGETVHERGRASGKISPARSKERRHRKLGANSAKKTNPASSSPRRGWHTGRSWNSAVRPKSTARAVILPWSPNKMLLTPIRNRGTTGNPKTRHDSLEAKGVFPRSVLQHRCLRTDAVTGDRVQHGERRRSD